VREQQRRPVIEAEAAASTGCRIEIHLLHAARAGDARVGADPDLANAIQQAAPDDLAGSIEPRE
jgi:hypothetical protein